MPGMISRMFLVTFLLYVNSAISMPIVKSQDGRACVSATEILKCKQQKFIYNEKPVDGKLELYSDVLIDIASIIAFITNPSDTEECSLDGIAYSLGWSLRKALESGGSELKQAISSCFLARQLMTRACMTGDGSEAFNEKIKSQYASLLTIVAIILKDEK
jgi:hypothetical protein